jgi:hypothetical protein
MSTPHTPSDKRTVGSCMLTAKPVLAAGSTSHQPISWYGSCWTGSRLLQAGARGCFRLPVLQPHTCMGWAAVLQLQVKSLTTPVGTCRQPWRNHVRVGSSQTDKAPEQ